MTSKGRNDAAILARVQIAVEAALDKKAEEIEVLDLRALSGITDFFLICQGNSHRQVQAIAEEIQARLRQERVRPGHLEGEREAEWVLIDYLDFVVHIFTAERRMFYGLEKIWSDAPRLELTPAGAAPGRASRP